MAITDEHKADTLNKHYHCIFTKEDDTDTPTLEPRDVEGTLTSIGIQKDEVLKKLKTLNIFSAAGPDNIHPRILKETQLEMGGRCNPCSSYPSLTAHYQATGRMKTSPQSSRRTAVRVQQTMQVC